MNKGKRMYKRGNSKNLVTIIVGFIVLLVSATITYMGSGSVTWGNIFSALDISGVSSKEYEYDMCVHFLDVGRADCMYIKCGKTNILIDAGDCLCENIIEYLKRRDVKKFDLVISTHPHRDHIGQMPNIIKNFQISCFIMPDVPKSAVPTSHTYYEMLKALRDKNINVRIAKPNERFTFRNKDSGKDLFVDTLSPLRQYENTNNNSIVTKMTYGNDTFLFMGDAEKDVESELINRYDNLKAKVLKIGHHGSRTSSSVELLKAVKPDYAVISSGPDRFNLPKEDIVERIESFGAKILRTDHMGNIIFLSNGDGLEFITRKEAS